MIINGYKVDLTGFYSHILNFVYGLGLGLFFGWCIK